MIVGGISLAVIMVAGCQTKKKIVIPSRSEKIDAVHAVKDATPVAPQKTKITKKSGGLYDVKPKPLDTAEQCAQCHISVFNNIAKQGGKHQIECVRCHTQFHMFNPKKRAYADVVPKCETCHGVFHGKGIKTVPLDDCASCHADPHAPLIIPSSAIENACSSCHQKEAQQITNNVSRHTTKVSCGDCHIDKHGFIPECNVCHNSHSPDYEMKSGDCMVCHPVHMPKKIVYSAETSSVICAGCHKTAYNMLQEKYTKHTDITCAKCHGSHKEIPLCSSCHGLPHSITMLQNTSKCGDCHGIAHDLPI